MSREPLFIAAAVVATAAVGVLVPEPLIGRIALGQRAEVRVDAYPGRAFPATVTKVAT